MLQLVNMNGSVYFSEQINFTKSQNTSTINLHNLSAGVYIVRVVQDGVVSSEKIYIGK